MKALILVADGFEDLTLFVPWFRLREAGVEVRLAGPHTRPVSGVHGYTVEADMPIHEANPGEYDLLVIPGGPAAERLRLREEAVDVARTFMQDGSRVVAVGHGLQVLITAQSLDNRAVTCAPGIRDDVRAAGAVYRDEGVVTDGNLTTARGPDDLPELCRHLTAPARDGVRV